MKIIRDTREKEGKGWSFAFYDCEIIKSKLDTGDYSLQGLEKSVCVERKRSSGEIAGNLAGKKKVAFFNELDRMKDYDHAYFICEFPLSILMDFPMNSGIPQKQWYKTNKYGRRVKQIRLTGKYIYSVLKQKSEECGFELIFCSGSEDAEMVCFDILKYHYENKR